MFKKLNQLLSELSWDTNTVKVYILIAVVNTIAVGMFGVVSGVNLYSAKSTYLASLETQRTEMSQKVEQLKELKSSYDTAKLFMDTFNTIMPTTVDFENYVVPFTNTLAQNGFLVTGMFPNTGDGKDTASITVSVEGDFSNVPTMLAAIEAMPRVTYVESITMTANSLNMPLTLRIYYVAAPKPLEEVK